ncbi:imidazole glycerol phosphate synthase subunit HisH [Cognatilysobacter bugurensis]|uniref:Imidazole glycerol phosphate synthase subunit HisH n=1 Tax=Cognatilysobacter bugurensis TaxID=543356 RepID=A0A918W7R6_9GAMM|nr:imidazole glycerol phosphate synthase subunit HisH [Lysobacter bugurensis]GHA73498.1 imidazole glycerol phosphate synthase subunit HisH [Lysobacter bugurensis]
MDVALIDSGGTNIGSVRYALERLGASAHLTSDPEAIRRADRVILPGVGAAAPGMARLRELGLVDVVRSLRQPLLGVCLGMQLLFESSEEGDVECLGVLPGRVRRIPNAPGIRVPHMGWNALQPRGDDPLLAGIDAGEQAYFVHSYAAPVTSDTLVTSTHGIEFAAVVRRGNRHGAQFHPERSASVGARLLENFLSGVAA